MIDVSNLKDALETLGFVAHGDIHEKVFPEMDANAMKEISEDIHENIIFSPDELMMIARKVKTCRDSSRFESSFAYRIIRLGLSCRSSYNLIAKKLSSSVTIFSINNGMISFPIAFKSAY